MRIVVAYPQQAALVGNRTTADRWVSHLRALGHRVTRTKSDEIRPADMLVALHARRSAPAVRAFRAQYPERPIIVILTGTDLYQDLPENRTARASLRSADRLVVLQACGVERLPASMREKARVVLQSAVKTPDVERLRFRPGERLEVCQLASLRSVKDPFRLAMAVRRLPKAVDVHVTHVGPAKTEGMADRAEVEMARNPRFRWLGAVSPSRARRRLAESHVMVLSSLAEGGANVISEAVVDHVPIIASRIEGTIGQLGPDYPGYYEPKDTAALAAQLLTLATEPGALDRLRTTVRALAPQFTPTRERATIRKLIAECTKLAAARSEQ